MNMLTSAQTIEFFSGNPTELACKSNMINQLFQLWEHPIFGEGTYVYVSIDGLLCKSDFFDIDDMINNNDYEPILIDGKIICGFEYHNTLPQFIYFTKYMYKGVIMQTNRFQSYLEQFDFSDFIIGNVLDSCIKSKFPNYKHDEASAVIYRNGIKYRTIRIQQA